jgi:methylthioribose-1-phosphate isomerase
MKMRETEIHEYARRLLDVRGANAVAVAAQNAVTFEKQNNEEEAENWRRIESTLKLMRGPHQS